MKKYIYNIFIILLAIASMTSCAEDEGTEPGNDPNPMVTVYQYKPGKPYNADNDVTLRFATNNKTAEVYYLAETTEEKDAHISSMGKDAYMDYVIKNGTKVSDISGTSNVDVTLTDMYGEYTITAVAVGNGAKASYEAVFVGLDWTDVITGTYFFAQQSVDGTASSNVTGIASNPTTLQVCTTDAKLYRFKDVFGTDYHLKINLIDYKGSDDGGEYQYFRVPAVETPYTFGKHGLVSVRDIGYWQNSDAFITDGGFESGMYANYDCFVFIQYYVAAGNIGYGYDSFIADKQ